jgi:hypothetical protein
MPLTSPTIFISLFIAFFDCVFRGSYGVNLGWSLFSLIFRVSAITRPLAGLLEVGLILCPCCKIVKVGYLHNLQMK